MVIQRVKLANEKTMSTPARYIVTHIISAGISACIFPIKLLFDTFFAIFGAFGSILIEVIEELQGVNGKISFCNLAPIVEKTFNIMGITRYASVFADEGEGLQALS